MTLWRPDPSFYPSPKMAMQAPPEKLAYLAMVHPDKKEAPDALGVVDVDPESSNYGQIVGRVDMPNNGDELHHFGWNACSSCLCPYAPHPHMERRYLIVPGINSSRIHILDTKPDPRQPKIVRVIEPEEFTARTGYTGPHTIHCGPEGIYGSALGSASGDGPGGIFTMDPDSFDVLGKWEMDRGPQNLAYDFFGTWATTPWCRASGVRPTWLATASTPTFFSKAVTATNFTFGICASADTSRPSTSERNSKWC